MRREVAQLPKSEANTTVVVWVRIATSLILCKP